MLVQGEAVIGTPELLASDKETIGAITGRLDQLERNIIGINTKDGRRKQGGHHPGGQDDPLQGPQKNNVNLHECRIRENLPGRHPEIDAELRRIP